MKIALSSTVSLMTKYVHKRPDSSKFQFVLRVPSELADRYPKTVIRKSLDTSDPALAMRRGDIEFARYQAEFARMRGDQSLKPAEVQTLAIHAAKELGTLEASEDYFEAKLQAWAKSQGFEDPSQFEHLPAYRNNTFLDQVDREALRMLQGGEQHGARLSDALKAYFAGHEKASDLQFKARVERDWKTLTDTTGDILVRQLSRKHANAWRDAELARGLKTDSVKRNSNSIRAVISADRHTGAVVSTGTALPPEHYIQQYESRGIDPNSVEVVGWRVGANKVAAVQALRQHSSLGLADAKHAVDSVLDGSPVRIKTNDAKSALDLAAALEGLNFTLGSPQREA